MALTDDQRAALIAEIKGDPAGHGLLSQGLSRKESSLDYHVWNTLRGASDGKERLAEIGCPDALLSDVSAALDELEA